MDFEDYVENQLWMQSQVVFSTVHVVGSNNDLEPWFGAQETDRQRALRLEEFERRLAADLAWLDRAFAVAEHRGARGVVLAMQANTFSSEEVDGYDEVVDRIAGAQRIASSPCGGKPVDDQMPVLEEPIEEDSAPSLDGLLVGRRHGILTVRNNVAS